MNIHRRLIVLVGLGMLLIMTITVLSLQNITALFSRSTKNVAQISHEVRKIWNIEQKIGDAARMIHEYVRTGELHYKKNYEAFHAVVVRMLEEMGALHLGEREMQVLASINSDFKAMEEKAERIFALDLSRQSDRSIAEPLVADLDSLIVWMNHDIERYKEENAARIEDVAREFASTKTLISILISVIFLTMVGFLLVLGVYVYKKVSFPLGQLWAGTEEISRGNLDYQVQVSGESDIVNLAERFNEMAQRLRASYANLEHALLERTQQLAALNSVAFTLGQSGALRDVLQKSLTTILEGFPDMEPRGGIFLCDPDGETLRLTAHFGLSPDFVRQEEQIRMGECLCGAAAQTGEMIFAEDGCSDSRHTRTSHEGHAHIVIPIKSRGISLGVLFLYPTKHFALRKTDIPMFDAIGAQLGMAVENLRLYAEVKESSEKYWDLFENSRDILFTADLDGRLTVVNEAMERFIGKSKHELIGRNILDFMSDDGKILARRILSGQEPLAARIFEFEVIKSDGSRAFIEISGRVIYRRQQPVGYQIAARDVTERKHLRELLVQAERLSAIGQIGVAVRHEINNPLTTIIGNTELLLDRYERSDDELKKRLQVVLDNALRIAEIVKQLQDIKQDRIVEYVKGVKMTDLNKGSGKP